MTSLRGPHDQCGRDHTSSVAIAAGIRFLHQSKMVHRDLKPENILLQLCCGKTVYKLTDFGYAKEYGQSSMCTSFVGTMQYVAPEILQNMTYNKDVDFWSFGIVVFECITGRRPFLPGESPMQWLVKVEKKQPSHIAVEWADDGVNVRYYDILPRPHRLSRVFEQGITDWLRLMLRWKPQERGGRELLPGEREWFTRLEEILTTKMVSMVAMCSGDVYSYPVANSGDGSLDLVMKGIHDDTGVGEDQQVLLWLHGGRVKDIIVNLNHEDGSHDNTLFLFTDAKQTSVRLVDQQMGDNKSIKKLITNPDDNSMGLHDRRRCYGILYSLMRDRAQAFSMLLLGQQAIIAHLNWLSEERRKKMELFYTSHTKTVAKLEFLRTAHSTDHGLLGKLHDNEKFLLLRATSKRILSSWDKNEKEMVSMDQTLNGLLDDQDSQSKEYDSLWLLVEEFIQSHHRIASLLEGFTLEFVDKALEYYDEAKYAERVDELLGDVARSCDLLMASIKHCDQLIERFNDSGDITVTMARLSRLLIEPKKLLEQVKNCNKQIESIQQRRQADIWQLLEKRHGPQQVTSSSSSPDPSISAPPLDNTLATTDEEGAVIPEVEESLLLFNSQLSVDDNDEVISVNNSLIKRLEVLLSNTEEVPEEDDSAVKVYQMFSDELVAMETDTSTCNLNNIVA